VDDQFSDATSIFDVRREAWVHGCGLQGGPISRRNPIYARVGNHLIISAGFDDTSSRTLEDTWAFDASRNLWKELPNCSTPALEGHKAVVSGFDMFSFGGHTGPGVYSSRSMSVHTLSIGLKLDATSETATVHHESDQSDSEASDSSTESNGLDAVVELPNGRLVPISVLRALIRRQQIGTEDDDGDM
jgi:hypothetical protein